ncbi:MAG TPA: cysteine hydrolase [Kiloniellaceae bacterium]|nr:cysteine hydrolase [Kiloniellaceae bacterium]HIP77935.1 cysteine hydrolase [Kiloniellaceae bacterium]
MLTANTALLAIDVQQAFEDPFWGRRNNPEMEDRALALMAAWRDAGRPVISVKHNSVEPASTLRPGQPGNDFKPGFEPRADEVLIEKTVNAAFIGTGLELELRRRAIGQIAVFGLTTDQCVSTTARVGANLGFEVLIVGDACAAFDQKAPDGQEVTAETLHLAHLTTLNTEFGRVVESGALIASLG